MRSPTERRKIWHCDVFRLLDVYCLLDIIDVADIANATTRKVAELYYALDEHLGIDWLLSAVSDARARRSVALAGTARVCATTCTPRCAR